MKRVTVSERALVYAPHGRDAAIAVTLLSEAGIAADACASFRELLDGMNDGAAVVVITEEALLTADLTPIAAWIRDQEEWSDLPFVLLTGQGGGIERNPVARRHLEILGNASFLERPFHPTTLISLVRSALRGRKRQYQARARLEALRDSETRLRLATENAEIGLWDVDPINDVLIWPPRVKAMFGISADVPVTMQDFYAGLHPDDLKATATSFAAACDPERRALYDVEYRTIGKEDGAIRWVAAKGRGLFDHEGRCRRVVGTAIEITSKKSIEAALRESEERFRNMADHAPVMTWVTDAAGRCTYLNRPWYEFTGQTRAEAEGFGWLEAVHPDDRKWSGETFLAATVKREPFRVEYRLRRADGVYRWAIDAASPRFDTNGEFLGYVGSVIEIEERLEMEVRLRESEARYRTLFNSIEAGFCVVEVDLHAPGDRIDYRIVEANPGFYRHTGLSHDILGLWLRHAAPDLEEHWYEIYGRVAQTGVPVRFEQGSDMLARWFDVYAFRTGKPEDRRVAVLFNDISARRDAEEQLRELNETLERRVKEEVAERTLAEDALRQAQKMEAVGQLTGGVAHDFNNLLTIIRFSVDLIRRPGVSDDRKRAYLDAISDTVDRAAKLTGQLLAFARRQPLKPEVFDGAGRIHDIMDMLGTVVGSRIEIKADLAAEPCFVEADASQFETALVNMIVNARDAMDQQGTLVITAKPVSGLPAIGGQKAEHGQFISITITDTGVGIPPDKLAHIFEPFYTTKEVGKGTGLGLSQVYGFAKQSGGDIAVSSELGRGTTFTLYLPQAERPVALDSAPSQNGLATADDGEGKRILVVEDNIDVGKFSTQLLGELGYETTWAANASEALELLDTSHAFDAVFSDVVMPGMSGIELGHEIRRRHPGLPVVLMSGYSHVLADQGRHGFELLQKPYAIEDLSRVLKQVL